MTEDLWEYTSAASAEQAARAAARAERERRTLAELLRTRGQDKAAAVAAMSGYRSDCVDNWNGGMYEVVLESPAAHFDAVDDGARAALETAARDITGADHFCGLRFEVQLLEAEPGWDRALFNRLLREREGRAELPASGNNAGG